MSLEDLEKKTKIQKKYLQALEECRFDDIKQSSVYLKNYVKKYVTALGENPEPFLDQFKHEELRHQAQHTKHPAQAYKQINFSSMPNIFRHALIIGVVCIFLLYLGFHVQNILQPPSLSVVSPSDGFITYESNIEITGKTDPETKVTVNEEVIKNDELGNFKQTITLSPGINTLIVKAENKHGKTSAETYHVIYKNNNFFSLNK
jgi:cytoskeletal protein RodZ